MDAKTFYLNTPKDELERVVKAAGIKMAYFRQIAYGHRKPSPEVTHKLVRFSGGAMTVEKLRPDFFGDLPRHARAEAEAAA